MFSQAFRSPDLLEEAHCAASHAITFSSITTDDVRITIEQEDGKVPEIGGTPDMFQVVCHASSARVMNCSKGCLLQVTTRELGKNGHIGIGEARIVVLDLNGVIEKDWQHTPVSAVCITVNSSYRKNQNEMDPNTTTSTLKLSKKSRTMR